MSDSGRLWPLVGRAAELDDLEQLLTEATEGGGGAVLLEGEAGVGRTSLVAALASGAGLLGIEVRTDRGALEHGPVADEQGGARVPARLVVLEDVHLWGTADLAALAGVARGGMRPGALVVVTLRPVPHRPEVAAVVTAWTRAGARHLEVRPLPGAAATELAEEILGASIGPALRGAVSTAGGNPQLVVDVVTTARDVGALQAAEGGVDAVVPGWRGAVERRVRERLDYVDDDVLDLLGVASVLGVSFVVLDLAAVAGRPVADVWRTLRHALAAGLVHARGDRLVFRHDVVRAALYGGLDAGARAGLHARAAAALREAGAPLAVVATHVERSR
ncbi:AAA family ATPase [Cellulomonas gilvus]|uniref:Transcriptional regulator, putative ATPase, winged helix family n=1 Tax=Cellulomonas gilvus (strain ATCC 13127 / NRRL B-14078) TaxID=593907 RepID=F8A4P1_CELGA|nr:AAA family ATPase [Cellulomonas gilvus]AEI10857.1 transcriptional regulator, putative ATPase, winged helix family [Cellulomonas gilvus ATCC 13127]